MGRFVRDRSDQTRELTGSDATMAEAEFGTAGNGANPFGCDLEGGPLRPFEDDPGAPVDIVPDEIRRGPDGARPWRLDEWAGNEPEPTVRPFESRPIDWAELP